MSHHTVSVTQASRSFSELLNKVHYQGESFDIKRGKNVIARLMPAAPIPQTLKVTALNEVFKQLPALEREEYDSFEAAVTEIRTQSNAEKNPWD